MDLAWLDLIEAKHPKLNRVIQAAMTNSDKSYLIYMAVRLLEMHRLLKPTGSIYLHCDPTMSHYLKLVMDAILGRGEFRNEIIWQRASGKAKGSQHRPRTFGTDSDTLLFYSKSNQTQVDPTRELEEYEIEKKFPFVEEESGRRYNTNVPIFRQPSMGARPNLCYTYKGVTNPHPSGWRVSKKRLIEMDANDEIIWRVGKRPLRKTYLDSYGGTPYGSLWSDIPPAGGKERTGYPTQKPLALLDRIIKASSNEGDVVFDPFCGCATALVAADRLKQPRQWVGIDISKLAVKLVQKRIKRAWRS